MKMSYLTLTVCLDTVLQLMSRFQGPVISQMFLSNKKRKEGRRGKMSEETVKRECIKVAQAESSRELHLD